MVETIIKQMLKIQRYHLDQIFRDLLDSYICIHSFGRMEKTYLEIIKKYNSKELSILAEILALIQFEYSKYTCENKDFDLLGMIYENISSNYKASSLGQFFTPLSITRLMTEIVNDKSNNDKFLLAQEPACGSGRNIISFYNQNPNTFFNAVDVDIICVKMCIVNMHLYSMIGSEVTHGNCLSMKVWGGYRITLDFPIIENMFGDNWASFSEEIKEKIIEINSKKTIIIQEIHSDEIINLESIYFNRMREGIKSFNSLATMKNLFNSLQKQEPLQETKLLEVNEVVSLPNNFEFKKEKKYHNQVSLFDLV